MNNDHDRPPLCGQVRDQAVEGRDVMGDAGLAAHVGSCVTCFRTLAELRDAPRLAAALRANPPAVSVSDRFWDDLAARTTTAAASAMGGGTGRRRTLRVTGFAAVVATAAAAWVLVAGRGSVVPPSGGVPRAPAITSASVGGEEDDAVDEAADVSDLDESALRQLLKRLRARAPASVSALAAVGDAQDALDQSFDDDGQVNDELAELDRPALLRIERSLAGASL
jgi:hypothetical protein